MDRTSGAGFVTFADGTTVFDATTHEHHWAKYLVSGAIPGGARSAKVGVTRSPNAGLSGQPDTYTDLVKLDVTAVCVTNTPPRFTCGTNQITAEDSVPQTVPNWATGIVPHSIVRVPTAFATDFTSSPAGTRILDPSGPATTPNPRVEGGVLHLTDANDAGGFGGWAIGPFTQQTFESLEASWKSRIGGGGGGGADGYSMNFGTDLADNFTGEEGTGTGLSVTVDTFDNGGGEVGLEIRWRANRVAFQAVPKDDDGSGNFLRRDQFVAASVSVSAAGVATFTYDGNTISAALPGYTGVAANQVNFGARTGGANDNHWIDDLSIAALPFDQSSVEAGQTVQFQVSNDNPGLFSAQPAVSPNGTLTYTPAPNACGAANITVIAQDNGGTACNGDDTSDPCVRMITITPVNDCPELASIAPLTTRQNQPVTFVLDATDPDVAHQGCPAQTLSAAVVTPPAHGTLSGSGLTATYTPNPGYFGPDSFQIAVRDGPCVSGPVTVQVTVILANQPPTCLAQLAPGSCTLTFPGDPTLYALALDNSQSCIQLDGSGSSDPDGDPLTYHWTINGFQVAMDPTQEPIGGGTGAGSGTVTLSGNTLTVNITFSGLSANTTAAHIHGPAGRGTNAAVLYPLNAFTTLGASSGTISGTVMLTDGTGGYTIAQQLQQLCEGLWYINIHTTLHPGGEIRGQIDPGTSAGATVTACLEVGCHTATLCVSDGQAASACSLSVCVITAGMAVEQCIDLLDSVNLTRKNKRPLLASLKAAAASFDRGNIGSAMNQLKAFQHKVRAQVAGADPAAAAALTECVQRILAATECSLSAAP